MGEFTEGRVCAGGCGKALNLRNKAGYCTPCWKLPAQKDLRAQYHARWYRKNRAPNAFSVTCKGCSKLLRANTKTGYCVACFERSVERREKNTKLRNAWDRRRMANPEAKMAFMVQFANRRAKKKGIPHGATLADLLPLPTVCPVLGIALDYTRGPKKAGSASIDRIVPSLGYVAGNVRIISWRANHLKSDGTPDELYAVAMDAMRGAKRIV